MTGRAGGAGPVILEAGPLHAKVIAAIHALSGPDRPWTAEEIGALMGAPGAIGLIAEAGGRPGGFLLARAAGGEAEILLLAVAPDRRRRGLATALLEAACRRARDLGARACFLEVAVDNGAALALYRRTGFVRSGARPGYFERAEGPPADALVLRRDLAPGSS